MKKLNNSGITTIEIILCFVLIFVMTFSMYGTVSSYNDKRVIEKDKNEILSYKYLLTKTIQDDFVNNELSHVSIENNFDPSGKKTYILHCTLKNGTKKILKVEQTLGYSTYNPTGLKNQSDSFMISYGTEGDLIEYPLPNLGSSVVESNPANGVLEHTVQELSIQDVKIEVLEHQVLSIQIVFYHPNFGNKYGISIMAPVNYVPDINLPLTAYTLLYNDNGGTGCHDKSIQKMEDDYWGTLCTPVRDNYTFLGWNTKSDGTGSTITSESKAKNNITVHAKWRKNQVHIKLNANGGSLKVTGNGYTIGTGGKIIHNESDIIHSISYGGALTSSGLTNWNNSSYLSLNRDGYSIDSNKVWNTAANGTGTDFDQTTAYDAARFCNAASGDCTVTLYANWVVTKYIISLNANGATNTPTSSIKVTYDSTDLNPSTITLPKQRIILTGFKSNYFSERHASKRDVLVGGKTPDDTIEETRECSSTFNGWTTTRNGSTILLSNIKTPALQPNISNYTNASGLWIKPANTTIYASFADDCRIELPTITRAGYTCGWGLHIPGDEDHVVKSDNIKASGSTINPVVETNARYKEEATSDYDTIAVLATCEACKYNIKFYKNYESAKGTMSDEICTYDNDCKLTKNAFARSGYIFKRWNTKKDGTGKSYNDGASVKNLVSTCNGSIKLYAIWAKK